MSQDFKLKFDEMRESDPTADWIGELKDEQFPTASNVRNLGLLWPDGKKMFLNYAYVVSGECSGDNTIIILRFTTHTVTVTGQQLGGLFGELMEQLPRLLACAEDRYNVLEGNVPIINQIEVVEK